MDASGAHADYSKSGSNGRMNEDQTRSSANTDPQLLLDTGPMMLKDFNPKGVLRFTGRKCVTCSGEIMDHWLLPYLTNESAGVYWCDRDGKQASEGIADPKWDVPDGFGGKLIQD